MLEDLKQTELDIAEEKLIRAFFGGSLEPDALSSGVLNLLNVDVNNYIKKFEDMVRPFMNDSGYVDGSRLKHTLESFKPKLALFIPEREFRLSELADEIEPIIIRMRQNVERIIG